jgi:hypothetical protein
MVARYIPQSRTQIMPVHTCICMHTCTRFEYARVSDARIQSILYSSTRCFIQAIALKETEPSAVPLCYQAVRSDLPTLKLIPTIPIGSAETCNALHSVRSFVRSSLVNLADSFTSNHNSSLSQLHNNNLSLHSTIDQSTDKPSAQ